MNEVNLTAREEAERDAVEQAELAVEADEAAGYEDYEDWCEANWYRDAWDKMGHQPSDPDALKLNLARGEQGWFTEGAPEMWRSKALVIGATVLEADYPSPYGFDNMFELHRKPFGTIDRDGILTYMPACYRGVEGYEKIANNSVYATVPRSVSPPAAGSDTETHLDTDGADSGYSDTFQFFVPRGGKPRTLHLVGRATAVLDGRDLPLVVAAQAGPLPPTARLVMAGGRETRGSVRTLTDLELRGAVVQPQLALCGGVRDKGATGAEAMITSMLRMYQSRGSVTADEMREFTQEMAQSFAPAPAGDGFEVAASSQELVLAAAQSGGGQQQQQQPEAGGAAAAAAAAAPPLPTADAAPAAEPAARAEAAKRPKKMGKPGVLPLCDGKLHCCDAQCRDDGKDIGFSHANTTGLRNHVQSRHGCVPYHNFTGLVYGPTKSADGTPYCATHVYKCDGGPRCMVQGAGIEPRQMIFCPEDLLRDQAAVSQRRQLMHNGYTLEAAPATWSPPPSALPPMDPTMGALAAPSPAAAPAADTEGAAAAAAPAAAAPDPAAPVPTAPPVGQSRQTRKVQNERYVAQQASATAAAMDMPNRCDGCVRELDGGGAAFSETVCTAEGCPNWLCDKCTGDERLCMWTCSTCTPTTQADSS